MLFFFVKMDGLFHLFDGSFQAVYFVFSLLYLHLHHQCTQRSFGLTWSIEITYRESFIVFLVFSKESLVKLPPD